jgi:hypothetical protein
MIIAWVSFIIAVVLMLLMIISMSMKDQSQFANDVVYRRQVTFWPFVVAVCSAQYIWG